jgi:hypothetical protein
MENNEVQLGNDEKSNCRSSFKKEKELLRLNVPSIIACKE